MRWSRKSGFLSDQDLNRLKVYHGSDGLTDSLQAGLIKSGLTVQKAMEGIETDDLGGPDNESNCVGSTAWVWRTTSLGIHVDKNMHFRNREGTPRDLREVSQCLFKMNAYAVSR
jgi:hypothetical protein